MEVKKTLSAVFAMMLMAVQIFGSELSRLPVQGSEAAGEDSRCAGQIALTFDDGPSAKHTAEILDILGEYGVKATFFLIGVNVVNHPDLLKREVAEGHEIGNHTFSHPHLKRVDRSTLEEELRKTEEAVYSVCGRELTLFRPPEGYRSEEVRLAMQSRGYRQVFWTIDTKDWAHNRTESIVRNIKANVCDGSIILMHDYVVGESHTADALRVIIPDLIEEGYEFVTVSELS